MTHPIWHYVIKSLKPPKVKTLPTTLFFPSCPSTIVRTCPTLKRERKIEIEREREKEEERKKKILREIEKVRRERERNQRHEEHESELVSQGNLTNPSISLTFFGLRRV